MLLQTARTGLAARGKDGPSPKNFRVEVLRTITHEGQPFTQGLEIHSNGKHLIETSGSYPPGTESFVRIVDPLTGQTLHKLKDGLENRFVEGIVQDHDGHWFASTYMDNRAIEYSPDLQMIQEHVYPGTGWGLTRTHDGGSWLATNGSEYLMTLNKKTFHVQDTKVVTCLGKRVEGLNELEIVDDFMGMGPALVGNVYLSRLVLALNPATAECIGVFNLDGLGGVQTDESAGFHVANGIAYNKTSGTFYVTGKNWDQMFEVRLLEDPAYESLPKLTRFLQFRRAEDASKAMLLQVSPGGDSFREGHMPASSLGDSTPASSFVRKAISQK